MFKSVLLVCAQALFVQSIAGQCSRAGLGLSPYVAEASLAAANWAGVGASPWANARLAAAGPLGAVGPFAAPWSGAGFGPASAAASNGGALPVSSASGIYPNGVSLLSENAIEGALAVSGALPFLGTVALEGALPTAGAGAVAYSSGNGEVAMLSENIGAADYNGIAGPLGYYAGALGYAAGPLGYNAGPLGYNAGPLGYNAGPLGYNAGPLGYNAEIVGPAYPRAGCGYGSRLI